MDADADRRARGFPSPIRWRLNWPRTSIWSSAHCTQRTASSLWPTGAPQKPMIPSPMNLSSVPSYLKIVSTISSKYSFSISTIVSAGGALAHGREAADVAVEDRELLNELSALLHLELAAHHLLGDVRAPRAA